MDKGVHIHVCLLICHGLGMVLGCTMMSLYILLGLCRSHIHVIDLHGRIKVDC
jgi:predicted esterase